MRNKAAQPVMAYWSLNDLQKSYVWGLKWIVDVDKID